MTTEGGHPFAYYKAVNQAANSLGWHFTVAAPAHHSIPSWPAHWHNCLEIVEPTGRPRFLGQLQAKRLFKHSLTQFLNQQVVPDKHSIIFVDQFMSTRHLKMLIRSLPWRRRGSLSVWLMLRYDPSKLAKQGRGHRQWIKVLGWFIRVHLFADSELMANKWRTFLSMPVHVLPIPLTSDPLPVATHKDTESILCWWPGRPHISKGSAVLQSLLSSKDPLAKKMKFIFAETMPFQLPDDENRYLRLPGILPRNEYMHWMAAADIILLPYEPDTYASNSSGIFVEAIAHGKIPLATSGTWMAHELRKHDLEELILDWTAPDIMARILNRTQDESIKAKLKKMQAHYLQYHSISGFAQAMQQMNPQGA